MDSLKTQKYSKTGRLNNCNRSLWQGGLYFNSTSSYIYTLSYALFSYKKNIYTWGGDYDLLKLMSRIVWLTADHRELCLILEGEISGDKKAVCGFKKKKCKNVTVSTMTATNKDITINLTPIPSHPIYIYRYVYIYK